jgi:AAHS family 4-hydroxybenzoate transporter-like MFS transporter
MQGKTVDITTVIDSAKFVGLPLRVAILTFFIMLVDGFDLQTMSFVAPVLIKEWGVDRSLLTPVLTASMIGMALGSFTLGWLGDVIGRKKSYVVCIVFLFVGSLLSAYCTNLTNLFIFRFITGIGLGGVTPLAATLISEWTPKKQRGLAVTSVVVAVPLGGMVGAAVAQWIIPAYGWRTIFLIGAALPFVFFALAWFLMPESPKFLAQRPARHPFLAKELNRLLGEQRFDGTETFYVEEPPAPPGNWIATLLSKQYRATTLLLWMAFSFNTLALYSFVNFLPTVLTAAGLPLEASLQGSKLFNFGGFFGSIGGALLIGLYGSRIIGSSLALIGGISTLLIGMTVLAGAGSSTQMLLLIWVSGMALNGMQAFLYAVGAHSYPTFIRAPGVGCAQAISRIGGVLSGGVAIIVYELGLAAGHFFYIVAGVIVVVVISFFSLRTHIFGSRQNGSGTAALAKAADSV